MKNKNVVLGLIAFVFAIGSAFASLLTPLAQDAYAQTKLTSADEQWECRKVGQCAEAGTIPCEVLVPTTASGNVKVVARPMNECPTGQILHNSEDDVQGIIEFYDVQ